MQLGDICARKYAEALLQQVQKDRERYNKNRQRAWKETNSLHGLPLYQREKLAPIYQKSLGHVGISFPDEGDNLVAMVPSLSALGGEYLVDLRNDREVPCECHDESLPSGVCSHMLYHARSIGKARLSLFHHKDRTAGWRDQYPEALEFKIPSMAKIKASALVCPDLKMPSAVKKPKGAPKKKRYKGALEGGGGRNRNIAAPHCGICLKKGHKRSRCPDKSR